MPSSSDAYPEVKVASKVSHISYESTVVNNVYDLQGGHPPRDDPPSSVPG